MSPPAAPGPDHTPYQALRLFEVAEVGPMIDQKTGALPGEDLTAGDDWPDDLPPLHPLADRFDPGTWNTPGRCICGEPLVRQKRCNLVRF